MPTQNSEVWSVFCCCCLVEVTKLNLGQNSEARFGTQPPGSVVPLAMIVLHLLSCRSYVVFSIFIDMSLLAIVTGMSVAFAIFSMFKLNR